MSTNLMAAVSAAVSVTPQPLQRTAARLLWPAQSRRAAALAPHLDDRRSPRVIMGPLNAAGQAAAWSRAIGATFPGTQALSMELVATTGRSPFAYSADIVVPAALHRGRFAWEKRIFGSFTHALLERASSVAALSNGVPTARHLGGYAKSGVRAGIVIHGSEMRDPRLHAEMYPASPFRDRTEHVERLQHQVQLTRTIIEESGLPTFVTTPDMLDFVPGATLVPIVVDVDSFSTIESRPALEREVPIVVHAPTNPALKGTAAIEPVLKALDDAGRITYRRIAGVPNSEMPRYISAADIVVDQILLGGTGVLAAESMAAGRLVIAHLHDRVRERVGPDAPIVDAIPGTFARVMYSILADRQRFTALAGTGPDWARTHHDGRATAEALAPFLGLRTADS